MTKEDLLKMDKEDMASLVMNLSSIIQAQSEEIANLKELYKLKTAERYYNKTTNRDREVLK